DGDGEVAMGNGGSLDAHTLAHDHRAGAAVEYHLGTFAAFVDIDHFQQRHEAHALGTGDRGTHRNLGGVQGAGHVAADLVVDRPHDVGDRLETGIAQVEHDLRAVGEVAVDAPLDGGAVGHPAGGGAV